MGAIRAPDLSGKTLGSWAVVERREVIEILDAKLVVTKKV